MSWFDVSIHAMTFGSFCFCQSKPIAFLPFSLPLSLFFLGTVAFGKLSLQHLACKMILGLVTLKNKSKRKQVGQGMLLDRCQ